MCFVYNEHWDLGNLVSKIFKSSSDKFFSFNLSMNSNTPDFIEFIEGVLWYFILDELSKKIFQISSLLLLEEIFITGFNRSKIRINIEINLKANNNLYHFLCDRILYKYRYTFKV